MFVFFQNVINGVMFITGDYDIEAHCSCSAVEPAIKVNNSLCMMPCPKNTEQKCGGYNSSIFNVYKMSRGTYIHIPTYII